MGCPNVKAQAVNIDRIEPQRGAVEAPRLFLAVLLDVRLHGLFFMPSGLNHMATRCVSMVRSQCVFSGIVMLGGFAMVPCGMREMF